MTGQVFKNLVLDTFINVINTFTPTLATSKFLEEGVLNPEEFVRAGDLLVYKHGTWTWESGDPQRRVPYLPPDKQFLITRKVPCRVRADSLAKSAQNQQEIEVEDAGSWIAPQPDDEFSKEIEFGETNSNTTLQETINRENMDDDDDDAPDMDAVSDVLEEEPDPASLPSTIKDNNIELLRRYDVSMTYDKYYKTPKIWLFGYNENDEPLKPEQVFSDVSEDHAHKTVTIAPHPHTGIDCAYIHPCRHAEVMKSFLQKRKEPLEVEQYFFLFLKFMSAVIPTIEYDITRDHNL